MSTTGAKRIAERYVKALFEAAGSALAAVEKDMAGLSILLKSTPEFSHFLQNPLLSRQAQAECIQAILASMKAHAITQQFMQLLASQRRLPVLPDIIHAFARQAQAMRGEMSAELIAATAPTSKQIAQVSERLGQAYGKKINLAVREDASLLGGMVIKVGSVQLDGSLAGKLARLGRSLKAA